MDPLSMPPARSMFSAQEQSSESWRASAASSRLAQEPAPVVVPTWEQSERQSWPQNLVVSRPLHYRMAKRALDVAVALVGLVLCAPIFVAIALLIRLDSNGPAFFIQERVGYLGKPFRMVKFRTMRVGSGVLLDEQYKTGCDPRVTGVGSWLRKTSIDELPQLWNVLRGQMSLVGPRPELSAIIQAHYEPWQYRRFQVPQGMTGWWQVNGRGTKLLYQHTDDDLYYIDHASFGFDLGILLRTVGAVIRREGAF